MPKALDARDAGIKGCITRSRFFRLLAKGFNPAYFVQADPEEVPTITIRRYSVYIGIGKGRMFDGTKRTRAVILSRGPEDANRRVVAEDYASWVEQFWIGMLLRQLRCGVPSVKAWCYETLCDVETEGPLSALAPEWIRDFSTKEGPC